MAYQRFEGMQRLSAIFLYQAFQLQLNIIVANAALGALARQTAWKEALCQLDEICNRSDQKISWGVSCYF